MALRSLCSGYFKTARHACTRSIYSEGRSVLYDVLCPYSGTDVISHSLVGTSLKYGDLMYSTHSGYVGTAVWLLTAASTL